MYDKLMFEFVKFIAIGILIFMIVIGPAIKVSNNIVNNINPESETTVIETEE